LATTTRGCPTFHQQHGKPGPSISTGLEKDAYAWIGRENLGINLSDCEDGDEEIMDRNVEHSKEIDLPWVAYHLACKISPNKRSREDFVLQIRVLLAEANLLP
jgi:hypothetical protein